MSREKNSYITSGKVLPQSRLCDGGRESLCAAFNSSVLVGGPTAIKPMAKVYSVWSA